MSDGGWKPVSDERLAAIGKLAAAGYYYDDNEELSDLVAEVQDARRRAATAVNLPKHIELSIRHNPHLGNYETIEQWLELASVREGVDLSADEREAIRAAGEVWVVTWWPETPVGSCVVAAPTFEQALRKASEL